MPTVPSTYRFGPFRLDVAERRLLRDGEPIPLRLKVFDTLRVLVEHAGRLVTKEELLQAIWPDTAVEENNLNHNVSILRKVLGEKATGQAFIETVPRVGYRFVAPRSRPRPSSHARDERPRRHGRGRRSATARRPTASASRTRSSGCGPAARQGVELAHAPRLRVGEPDLAALVGRALATSPRRPLRRARQRHVAARRRRRQLRHVGAGPRDRRRCRGARSVRAARDLARRVDRHCVRREAPRARQPARALRRLRHRPESLRHRRRARVAPCPCKPDPPRMGAEQPGVLQGVHLPVHPARDARPRSLVRRAATRVDITGERRSPHADRR